MATPPSCTPIAHHWRLDLCLVMGLANADGWYPVTLMRTCPTCQVVTLWAGEQQLTHGEVRQREEQGAVGH
jgi:hypothetical protein